MTIDQFTTIPAPAYLPYEDSYQAELMPLIFERLRDPKIYEVTLMPGASAFGGHLKLGSLGRIIYSGVFAKGRAAILSAYQEAV